MDSKESGKNLSEITYSLGEDLSKKVIKISNDSLYGIYTVILSAGLYVMSNYEYDEFSNIDIPMLEDKDKSIVLKMNLSDYASYKDFLIHVKNFLSNIYSSNANTLNEDSYDDRCLLLLSNIHKETSEHLTRKYDIVMHFEVCDKNILVRMSYNCKEYLPWYIESVFENIIKTLEYITENINITFEDLSKKVESLNSLVYNKLNDTKKSIWKEATVNQLFEEVAAKNHDKVALICNGKSITYHELNKRSNILANELIKNGVGQETLVGVMTNRSIDLFVSILGTLKAGAGYVPMDSNYPQDRVTYILKESNINILLINDDKLKQLGKIKNINVNTDLNYLEEVSVPVVNNSSNIAYVIFTSGSTGKPKGVVIEHKALVNFIYGIKSVIEVTQTTKVLNATTVSFDIFAYESFVPLLSGATVILANDEEQNNVKKLGEMIEKFKVDLFQTTPSKMNLMLDDKNNSKKLSELKHLVIGGEPFPSEMLTKIRKMVNAEIYNFYGPTEATVWATYKKLNDEKEINIGKPLPNYEIYIIGENNKQMPIGSNGEIGIAGEGLARGYLNNKKLTSDRFIKFIDNNGNEKRLYKTGDIGKVSFKGEIQCFGRKDNQIKLRGYRIELGEIEHACIQYKDIKDIAVLCIDVNGEKSLVAYYIANEEIEIKEMRHFLVKSIPLYMIPQYYIKIDKMPLNINGKVDRLELEKIKFESSSYEEEEDINSEIESTLLNIWKSVLNRSYIGIHDNFFDIGGTSVLLLTAHSKIDEIYTNKITVLQLFDMPTIKEIADFLEKDNEKDIYENEGIQFPDEYFDIGQYDNYELLSQEINNKDLEILNILIEKLNISMEAVFLGMFNYCIYQITEIEEINTPIIKNNEVMGILIHYSNIKNMEDLFNLIDQKLKSRSKKITLNLSKIKDEKRYRNKVYPLFCIDKIGSFKELENSYDLIIRSEIVQGGVKFLLSYKKEKLLKEKVIVLFESYRNLIKALIDSIKE
ncbi:amino acid adenylation domain-containing protein [Lachnotalea glycerini]|uniref:Amino acid adenylation domain-containing protein n=1 Tax=Lachnotalea glycerini TaxID=1763509 RepID=A0A318F202_9FIRM|nr:non-ribosomal peptide synthetase [Lachnotalea glycerini]PXV95878.1 amino acid adenylation domain-containing protein [Lachnotalea glycerini]